MNIPVIERVILVDAYDMEIGTMEKLDTHQKALLHRAFSIFIFNSKGDLLLQRRNESKYHSGGLWTNTCCGHPRPGEDTAVAARRRLKEEMGFSCDLTHQFSFIYKAVFENGLTEHEFDHVYFGSYSDYPEPDPLEASDWKYHNWQDLLKDVKLSPDQYTVWFKICMEEIFSRNILN